MDKKQIRNFFASQLDAEHIYFSKDKSHFKGQFRGIAFTMHLEFKKSKIKKYELYLDNYKEPNPAAHLDENGKACLGIDSELKFSLWEIIICIMDWLQNYYDITNGIKKHDHGYRHGLAGIIEWKLQELFLPFEEGSIDKLSNRDFIDIQKNARAHSIKSKHSYKEDAWEYKKFLKNTIISANKIRGY